MLHFSIAGTYVLHTYPAFYDSNNDIPTIITIPMTLSVFQTFYTPHGKGHGIGLLYLLVLFAKMYCTVLYLLLDTDKHR